MFALIKYENQIYYSIIVAIKNSGLSSKVIAFDKDYSTLHYIPFWTRRSFKEPVERNVYILNSQNDNWIKRGKFEGIPEMIDNIKLIKKNKSPLELINLARQLQSSYKKMDWYPITDEKDVASFNELTFALHDAIITKIVYEDKDKFVYINTTWQCFVVLRCKNVIESNIEIGLPIRDDLNYFDFSLTNKIIFKPSFFEYNHNYEKIIESRLICSEISYSVIVNEKEIKQLEQEYEVKFEKGS